MIPLFLALSSSKFSRSGYSGIRITYDTTFLEDNGGKKDQMLCSNSNQRLTWNGTNTACSSGTLNEQIKYINATAKNVATYLKGLVACKPSASIVLKDIMGVSINSSSNLVEGVEKTDTDLHITFLQRPVDSSRSSFAIMATQDPDTKRPTSGFIVLDYNVWKDIKEESKADGKDYFYSLLLQLTLNLMGINYPMMQQYYNIEDGQKHTNPICTATKGGRKFTYLSTPYAANFYNIHFPADTPVGGCRGIELENSEHVKNVFNDSYIYSFVESRIFYTEIMTAGDLYSGHTYSQKRLTDLTLAILLDTGFYDVDPTKAKNLIWGNKKIATLNQFSVGTPSTVFPTYYFPNSNKIFMDFKHILSSEVKASTINCDDTSNSNYAHQMYCKGKDFYGTTSVTTQSDQDVSVLVDFMPLGTFREESPLGNGYAYTNMKATTTSFDTLVSKIECKKNSQNKYESYTVLPKAIDDQEPKTCSESGNVVNFNKTSNVTQGGTTTTNTLWYNITCEDPNILCNTMDLYENNIQDAPFNFSVNPDLADEEAARKRTETIAIAVGVTVAVVIILVIVGVVIGVVYTLGRKRRQQEDFNRLKAIAASVRNRKRSATSATTGKRPAPPVAQGGPKRVRASTTAAAPKSFTDLPPDDNQQPQQKTAAGDKLNQVLFIDQMATNRENAAKEEKPQDVESAPKDDDLAPGATRARKNSF